MPGPLTGLQRAIPFTLELNPFSGPNLVYWASSYMLTRVGIGATRIVADSPALDPRPDVSRRQKRRNQLERIFIETFGTLGTYVSLHASQDIAATLIERLKPSLAPSKLLETTAEKLTDKEQGHLKKALADVYKRPESELGNVGHVLFHKIFGNGRIEKLAEKLELPELLRVENGRTLGKIAKEVETHFAPVNRMANLVLVLGIAASAYLSGAPIQWFNDRVLREKLGPKLLNWISGPEEASPTQTAQASNAVPSGKSQTNQVVETPASPSVKPLSTTAFSEPVTLSKPAALGLQRLGPQAGHVDPFQTGLPLPKFTAPGFQNPLPPTSSQPYYSFASQIPQNAFAGGFA